MAAPALTHGQGRLMGGILVLLGALALREGWRLHGLRTRMVAGAVVGDDTFPLVVGASLVVLGVTVAVLRPPAPVKVAIPDSAQRGRMLAGVGLLVTYWLVVPYVGYTGSTALVSTGLYRAMGGYRWPVAIGLGGVTTGLLYLVFRVWLLQPLPTGFLGR